MLQNRVDGDLAVVFVQGALWMSCAAGLCCTEGRVTLTNQTRLLLSLLLLDLICSILTNTDHVHMHHHHHQIQWRTCRGHVGSYRHQCYQEILVYVMYNIYCLYNRLCKHSFHFKLNQMFFFIVIIFLYYLLFYWIFILRYAYAWMLIIIFYIIFVVILFYMAVCIIYYACILLIVI